MTTHHRHRPVRHHLAAVKTAFEYLGIVVLAVLYGAAYAAIGVYISMFLDACAVPRYWQEIGLLSWVAVGAVALTVWTIRFAGISVRKAGAR